MNGRRNYCIHAALFLVGLKNTVARVNVPGHQAGPAIRTRQNKRLLFCGRGRNSHR